MASESLPLEVRVRAPAKINLGLRVFGKRPDGYHNIDTLFVAVDLYDDLVFERNASGGVKLTWRAAEPLCATDDFPTGESNLIIRAVRILERDCGFTAHLTIHLTKRIPIAAGLGGGSSDAAATLYACNRLYDLGCSVSELTSRAAKLGADVPFFLGRSVARGTGRGDVLHPASCSTDWWAVLICPPIHLPVGEVFGALRLTERPPVSDTAPSLEGDGFFSAIGNLHNDLEAVVISRVPSVVNWRGWLFALGARGVFVSGSGPTVVGVFDSPPRVASLNPVRSDGDQIAVVRPVKTPMALMNA